MRKAAIIVGALWMAACAFLWLYVGFFTAAPDLGAGSMNWTVVRMMQDSRLGMTFLPICLLYTSPSPRD